MQLCITHALHTLFTLNARTLVYMSYRPSSLGKTEITSTSSPPPPPARSECSCSPGRLMKLNQPRLLLPCRDREVSDISGGVMFDWGLLALPVLFLFVNRLPGNAVIIVAEASICSFRGGGGGYAELPSFQIHFPRCWWEAAGWRGWMFGWEGELV